LAASGVSSLAPRRAAEFRLSWTRDQVIVDHTRRLHQRVADRRAHELESARSRSRLIASDSAVRAGTSAMRRQRFCIGLPPTKLQRYASRLPNSSRTARDIFAF